MSDTRRTVAERFYRRLLHLYPRPFRERFAADLVDLFRDTRREAARRGRLALAAFWLVIVTDLIVQAAAERLRQQPGPPAERGPFMPGILHDVRHAVRLMARRPALSAIVVLTMALGIGANTAIFSLVHTVLLAGQPYPEADRLVNIREHQIESSTGGRAVRPANFFDWQDRVTSFQDVAWSRDGIFALTGAGEPESIIGYRFSPNMLDVLGVQPAIGRNFREDENVPGADGVVLLSDPLWKRRFGGDPGILGRSILLDGRAHTVIGVMPPSFTHPRRAELWVPIALTPALAANRTQNVLRLVGRLKPGVSREAALAELSRAYDDLTARHPETIKGLAPFLEDFAGTGDAKPLLLTLMAAVGFVLLIACANIANLLLADVSGRRRELAVRTALGASRARLVRQMLTEGLLLAMAGGTLGALVTYWLRDALLALFPTTIFNLDLPLVERIDMGPAVILFALGASATAGLLFGVVPALHVSRASLHASLKEGDRGSASRTPRVLIVGEVALSIVLLAGALLMVQSFLRVQQTPFGFEPDPVLSGRLILPPHRYADAESRRRFAEDLLPRLRAIPGVEAAGLTNFLPLSGWSGSLGFEIEGQPAVLPSERPLASFHVASEDYFRSMGIPIVRGRAFTGRDAADAPPVVIVNEALARRYFSGGDPVGRRLMLPAAGDSREAVEIVGVAGDVRAHGLEEPVDGGIYFPIRQQPSPLLGITLRTRLDPASLAGPMRTAVWGLDPDQPVTYVMPLAELASESLTFRRAGMLIAAGFGALALLLAAIGIYGVLSYAVSRRTRELGVRMALGATPHGVARLVVREGLTTTAVGVGIGLAAAAALTRSLESLLYEVRPGDPLTYATVAGVLLLTALLATWVPARRATTVDPLVAMRSE